MEKYDREVLITNTKGGDINDKDNEESKEQQIHKKVVEMERKCQSQINEHEKTHATETSERTKGETNI